MQTPSRTLDRVLKEQNIFFTFFQFQLGGGGGILPAEYSTLTEKMKILSSLCMRGEVNYFKHVTTEQMRDYLYSMLEYTLKEQSPNGMIH
jgi:hypothetical protein